MTMIFYFSQKQNTLIHSWYKCVNLPCPYRVVCAIFSSFYNYTNHRNSHSFRKHFSHLFVRRVLLRPVLDAEVLEARYAAVEWGVDSANMETLRHLHACLKSITNVPVITGVSSCSGVNDVFFYLFIIIIIFVF